MPTETPRDEASICNLALSRIGHTQFISDLANDPTTEADACRVLYYDCRNDVLESAPWPFATRRYLPSPIVATTLTSGAVPTGWQYAYAFPADATGPDAILGIWSGFRVTRHSDLREFAVEYDNALQANVILSNEVNPEIFYIAKVASPTRFSAKFTSAVAWRLAVELVLALRKDAAIGERTQKAYALALADAAAQGLQRGGAATAQEPDPDYIAARSGSSNRLTPSNNL